MRGGVQRRRGKGEEDERGEEERIKLPISKLIYPFLIIDI